MVKASSAFVLLVLYYCVLSICTTIFRNPYGGSSSSSSSSIYVDAADGNNNNNAANVDGESSTSTSNDIPFDSSFFAESQTSLYSGYQQAWRMLGYYVECSAYDDDENENEHGSHDNNNNNNNNNYQMNTCQRYLLWAAYVDTGYSGGGIGEYSFYDTSTNTYTSEYSCDVDGNGRCVPLDCHEQDTSTWQLLGVYKEAYYSSEWFEQLFKHEGYCLWNYNTYYFMKTYYASWPEACLQTNIKQDENGKSFYIDLKPAYGGNIAYGIYTDSICKTEYEDQSLYSNDVAEYLAKKGYVSGSYLETFNKNMNVYKYCQPCRTYYIPNFNGNSNNNNNNNNNNKEHRDLGNGDDDYDPNNGNFACYDDAGYTNVNQCMKFRTHTYLQPATISNLQLAHEQGGILEITVLGVTYGTSFNDISTDGTYQDVPSSLWNTNTVQYALASRTSSRSINISIPFVLMILGILTLIGTIVWKVRRATNRIQNRRSQRKQYEQNQQSQQPLKEPLVTESFLASVSPFVSPTSSPTSTAAEDDEKKLRQIKKKSSSSSRRKSSSHSRTRRIESKLSSASIV